MAPSAAIPTRPPTRPPTRTSRAFPQARAQATYRALLAAARDVFSERGFDGGQSPEIAARAGVSVGTFYRYFTDKRQAFVEMIADHLTEAHADVMRELRPERFAGAERAAALDAAIDVLFAHVARMPALHEVFLAMALRDADVGRLKRHFDALSIDALSALVAVLVPRSVIADPRAAAFVLHHAATEVALALGASAHTVADEHAVKHALREMAERYLFPEVVTKRPRRGTRRR